MWPDPQETADLVTFIGEILNGKLHFLCSECTQERNILCSENYFSKMMYVAKT